MPDLMALVETLPLRADVHAAVCYDGLVLLDIGSDAYLALHAPRPTGEANAHGTSLDRCSIKGVLADASLLVTPGEPVRKSPRPPSIAWRSLPAVAPSRPPLAMRISFLVALAEATLRFHIRSFAGLIAWANDPRRAVRPVPDTELARLVGWFDRLSLWLPFRPLCLFRSFFLLHYLRRQGFDAQWVFGVAVFPFHAHCWLADDAVLIGESPDRAEEFETIFLTGSSVA